MYFYWEGGGGVLVFLLFFKEKKDVGSFEMYIYQYHIRYQAVHAKSFR